MSTDLAGAIWLDEDHLEIVMILLDDMEDLQRISTVRSTHVDNAVNGFTTHGALWAVVRSVVLLK